MWAVFGTNQPWNQPKNYYFLKSDTLRIVWIKTESTKPCMHEQTTLQVHNQWQSRLFVKNDERILSITRAVTFNEFIQCQTGFDESSAPLHQLLNVCVWMWRRDWYSLCLVSYFSLMPHCVSAIDICCPRSAELFSSPLL